MNPKKLPAFYGKRFFCQKCKNFYTNYRTHPCHDPCRTCLRKECLWVFSEKRTCSDCFKTCHSVKCFDHHKKIRKSKGVDIPSKCDKSFRCQACLAIVETLRCEEHKCGESVCHICKEFVMPGHFCYMQRELPKRPNDKLIFYDFETDFSSGEHEVNYVVAQYGDGTEFVFKGYDSLNKFCLFLFDRVHENYTAIAHNAKAFDGIFVQKWLIENRPTADIHVIHSGQKIMQLTIGDYKIRLIDSLNFLQMPLCKFPTTFGLDTSKLSKGDFPFKFNTRNNQNYVGPIPDVKFYSPDTRTDNDRSKLLAWHTKLKNDNYIFNFQNELYRYCSQDVTILHLCCVEFHKTFLPETNVDLFCYCTIAASVMAVYRSKYLKENTIAILPKNLYRDSNKPFSKSSIEWLQFISFQTNSNIQHAINGGEKVIVDDQLGKKYSVDGFCEETNTVFEFYGCVYHGCPSCFDGRNDHPFHSQREMTSAYNDTIRREQRLRDLGYELKTIWEHDYRQLKNTNEMRQFLDMFDIVTDLEPRDAFFGGRVNGFKLFRDAQEGETISYVDFTSLYPFVNKNKKYPIRANYYLTRL